MNTMSYLPTGLAGCSMDPEISYGVRKRPGHHRLSKKKNRIINMVTPHPCYDGQINPD